MDNEVINNAINHLFNQIEGLEDLMIDIDLNDKNALYIGINLGRVFASKEFLKKVIETVEE